MEPHYQRQDRQRGDYKPRNFRNKRGAYSNRQHRNYYSDQSNSGSYIAEASNAAPGSSCEFDGANGAYSTETNYDLTTECSQLSKSRNNSNQSYSKENQNNNDLGASRKTYENSKLNVNAPSFTSIYNHPNPETETSVSRRGAIVGGRYIRKNANHSVEHPHANKPSNYENSSYEQNANYSSHSSAHKSRNFPNNQRYQSKPFADSDTRRQFPPKSSRTFQASGHRSNEENLDARRQFPLKNSDYSSRSSNGQRPNEEDTRRQFSSKPSRNNDYFSRPSQTSGQRLAENDSDVRRQYSSKPSRNTEYPKSSEASEQRLNEEDFDSKRPCSSKPSRNSDYTSRSTHSSGQRLNENDFDGRRQFPLKPSKNSDYSSRFSQSSGQRLNENTSASTDVYRFPSSSVNEKRTYKSNRANNHNYEIDANQRELLIQQLNKGDYECLVCCDRIRVKDQIWHCLNCYHVFHLRCIRKWARSPAASVPNEGWRCPACQNLTPKIPFDYFCFCGSHNNPDVNYHLTPHTCGEICGRNPPDCSHPCKELCHPGPCPPCSVVVQKSCACGKTVKALPCKQDVELTCSSVCEKPLNCGMHRCTIQCHPGECPPCAEEIDQECYCKKSKKTVVCDPDTSGVLHFSCGEVCGRLLSCGNHSCDNICHPSDCSPCSLSTEIVKYCPCGKTSILELIANGKAVERKSCKDPIPLCNKICEKVFFCGPKDDLHKCPSACHEGDCPKCPLTTLLKCRCGASTKEFPCAEIEPSFVFLCERRCNRRKVCGRHKCLNNCCINIEHRCELICNKKLSCGNHQCQDICHAGNCPPCGNVSFDELRCHCGESVLYPPIHCGTRPPECTKPCIRSHPCDHEVKHTCHSEETCPPCTALTVKWCFGNHKQCTSVMCFLEGVSCGMLCLKDLPCGKHKCNLTCHAGPCLKEGAKCAQLCAIPRSACGHPCGNACHDGPCPDTPCKSQVSLACPCGRRSETTTCYDSTKSYRLMTVSVLATKMQEIKEGQSVNLNDVLGRKSKNNKLQCNEECAVLERNKRLAVALQIQNPELSPTPGPPSYSEFLKAEAKKNPAFVGDVYNKITELVQLAKDSKQKCRSHSFPPMNRDHRRVVHELAEFFGCETQSYDEEPKKSVVVTAYKNKCWLPFVSIMNVVQRDMGFRKGPAPVLTQRESKNGSSTAAAAASNTTQKKKIDYFDYNE
ncbi:unnamed protein product [Larinioides sclopetarius]